MAELAEQHDMWKALKLKEQGELDAIANPMVKTFGADPEKRKCKDCLHLYSRRYSKTYWKCDFREETRGAGSDHRVNWPACTKYERYVAADKK